MCRRWVGYCRAPRTTVGRGTTAEHPPVRVASADRPRTRPDGPRCCIEVLAYSAVTPAPRTLPAALTSTSRPTPAKASSTRCAGLRCSGVGASSASSVSVASSRSTNASAVGQAPTARNALSVTLVMMIGYGISVATPTM